MLGCSAEFPYFYCLTVLMQSVTILRKKTKQYAPYQLNVAWLNVTSSIPILTCKINETLGETMTFSCNPTCKGYKNMPVSTHANIGLQIWRGH